MSGQSITRLKRIVHQWHGNFTEKDTNARMTMPWYDIPDEIIKVRLPEEEEMIAALESTRMEWSRARNPSFTERKIFGISAQLRPYLPVGTRQRDAMLQSPLVFNFDGKDGTYVDHQLRLRLSEIRQRMNLTASKLDGTHRVRLQRDLDPVFAIVEQELQLLAAAR